MENKSRVPEVIFLVAVVALAVVVLVMSRDFEFRAFLLPIVGVIPAGLLAVHQLVRLARGKPSDSSAVDYAPLPTTQTEHSPSDQDDEPPGAREEPMAPHWMSFAWLAALSLLVYLLGLLPGAMIFTVVYMRFRARDRFWQISLVAATTGAVFVVLVNFLGAPIFRGSLL